MTKPVNEKFIPLSEKAVRRDGTINMKIIGPGWGSSGFYSREVLERDIPNVFPAGTHNFWNHDTPTEEMERPEGDLSRLASVLISDPVWREDGLEGEGMYADARVFAGYREAIDEIGGDIGVSIRAAGSFVDGEIDGRSGRIVQQLVPDPSVGARVDYVTRPGAGGAIVQVFESAPGAGKLPNIDKLKEAHNLGEWLESRLHLRLTEIADNLYGDGHITREERKAMSAAIGAGLESYRDSLLENAPQLFTRSRWAQGPHSDDVALLLGDDDINEAANAADDNHTEVNMETLEQANGRIEVLEEAAGEKDKTIAALQERLILSEAKDHVAGKMAKAELPDMTKERLTKALLINPPVKDGKVDAIAYDAAIEAAVTEAKAEIDAIVGESGGSAKITGEGDSGKQEKQPNMKEILERQEKAFANMGYAPVGGKN